jgi:hypothetical protein
VMEAQNGRPIKEKPRRIITVTSSFNEISTDQLGKRVVVIEQCHAELSQSMSSVPLRCLSQWGCVTLHRLSHWGMSTEIDTIE